MTEADVAQAIREALLVVVKLGAPALLTGLAAGVVMSLVQAVLQVNEATLAFVPKAVAVGAVLSLTGNLMLTSLTDFSTALFDRAVAIGSQ